MKLFYLKRYKLLRDVFSEISLFADYRLLWLLEAIFLSSSLARKRAVTPLAITMEAIQPINPRYRTRMAASMRGDKPSPKDAVRLRTGRTLMSPYR